MIPRMNIIAWSAKAPWPEMRQVEQDLIISRALVELFADPALAQELRFRGGTALHKLHLPKPLRYSEDIDLVRTAAGPIGPAARPHPREARTLAWSRSVRAKRHCAEAAISRSG